MCDPIAQRLRKTRTTFADKTHNPAAQFIAGAGHLRATGTATAATSQRDQRGRTEWGLWNSGGCKRRELLGRDGVEDVDVALVHHRELLRRRAHQRLRRRRRGGVAPAGSGGAIRRGWPGIVVVRRGLRRHRLGIGRWRCADGLGSSALEGMDGSRARVMVEHRAYSYTPPMYVFARGTPEGYRLRNLAFRFQSKNRNPVYAF